MLNYQFDISSFTSNPITHDLIFIKHFVSKMRELSIDSYQLYDNPNILSACKNKVIRFSKYNFEM